MMSRPQVTDAERHLARQQDLDRAAVDRIGIDAATRIGFRAQSAAVRAFRVGRDPTAAARDELHKALPILIDAMVVADLTGRNRAALVATKAAARLSLDAQVTAYAKALEMLRKRQQLSREELLKLTEANQAQALQVLKKAEESVENELQSVILKTTTAGEHVREGRKAIGKAFDRLGMTPNNSFTLEAIFRTQTAMAYSAGRWHSEQAPEIQEILWGYKYVTVGDDRVRPSHVGFDGATLPKSDLFWTRNFPPNGWCCRCTALSIFEKRSVVEPPDKIDVDGKMVKPEADPGFRFNPGQVWSVA